MKQSWTESIKKIGIVRIGLMLLAGVVLVLCSVPLPGAKENRSEEQEIQPDTKAADTLSYEEKLEERLEEILGQVDGVRSVDVMITLACGTERVLEKEEAVLQESQSEQAQGGTIKTGSKESRENTTVLTQQKDGSRIPYVLKEVSPVVEGVLVVAEGEITPAKIAQISEAVQALFHIEAHKVKVLEKKMQAEG